MFSLKSRVLRTNFAKISVFGAETLPKSERNGPENAEFFETQKTKGIRTDTRCEKVGLWSGGAWKGGRQSSTYPYTSDMWVPLPNKP